MNIVTTIPDILLLLEILSSGIGSSTRDSNKVIFNQYIVPYLYGKIADVS